MANNNISVNVVANTSSMDSSFEKSYNKAQRIYSKPIKTNVDIQGIEKSIQPLGKITSNFKEFEKSLDAATARVVAFTATTGLIYGLGNAFKRLTSDAIQVEAAVARIQGILKASDKELSSFTDSIFKLANNTGQGFYDAAKAAEEFARQGLSLQQTLKATESALILTRLSGSSLEETINGLVATVSSFSNELLDYGKVVNTLASIDAKFSTSAAGLVEGIKRVGSVASDAGVSFEELSSSIAAIRQITGRSESVIGNGLKTIFTNLQTEKVQQELAKLGIQTQKSTGEFLPLINVIDQLAAAFQNLNDSQRADLGQKVAGKYQINTFKALIQSFGGKDTSLFDQALQTAKGAQDEAIRRNELLNKTTLSTLNQLNNSITALGASFGDKVGKPLVDTLTEAANKGLEVLTGVFKDNPIGDFLTGGIVSALKGPGIALAGIALGKLTKRIVFELTDAVKSVGGLNSRTQQNLKLDEAITNALKNGNAERVKAVNLATTLEEKQRQINALLRESYPSRGKSVQPYSPLTTLVNPDTRKQVLKSVSKNAANGILPAVVKEQNSIYNGVGGARKTARPVIANINMAGGSTPVVVNTDEHIIRNFANTGKDAVFNRNMTRQAGGAQSLGRFGNVEKVMAAGYTPRVKGVTPSILEAPFIPTSGETFGLDPRKLDFIRKITENVTGARTKPVRFRKNLENYGEFWPDSNNVLVNPKVISDKSPYYGGYSVPAHEYGHFMEYNSDPALMDLFKSAYKFDVKKKGSLFNQMYKKIGSGAGYSKKNYFSESFADTFAYSFLDRGDREPALGGRAMSDLMRELIMNNIPVKSKANGFIPNFARRSRFQEKDDDILGLLDDLDLDNIGYIPGGRFLSDRSVRRGSNWESFTRFTADRKNRIIKIEDTESRQKGDAFKNYSAIADFAKRKDFIIKSSALVKQRSRDNTKDKGIDLLYKLFPQLRYRDGVTKNTSGKYHIGESEKKFSSFHDLRSQIGQLGDDSIRKISKFSDIQDNFAGGIIPNFAIPQKLGEGAFGTFYKLRNNIGVKKFKDGSSDWKATADNIADEYESAKYLGDYPKLLPGLEAPKVYGSLERSIEKRRIGKSIVNGKTLDDIGLPYSSISGISNMILLSLKRIGISATDLGGQNLMVNEKGAELLNKYKGLFVRGPVEDSIWHQPKSKLLRNQNFDTFASAFARRGGKISIVDTGGYEYGGRNTGVKNPDYGKLKDKLAAKRDLDYAGGIIPNFANPLKDSISREYDALSDMGYPSYVAKNSIKVGSHDRLKSGNNPNGLGVYNTAQGQMSLGQALGQHAGQSLSSGIIPNFADLKTSTEKVSSKNLGLLIISTKRLSNSFSYLGDYLSTSFLSSIRKTTGSIIDISDAANAKYKGIIDPTNTPSNKKAALLDPTGQAYGQSETVRRLGLPIPTPVSQGGISSNIVGLPSSLKSGKSVNYKDFKDTPIPQVLLSLDVASERKREAEAKKKSNDAINEYIQNDINKSSPYGSKISLTQQKIRFTPNDMSETVKRLGLPMPTPVVKGGISSPIAQLPPSLRDNARQVANIQIPPTQTTIERLALPAPTPVKNNPPVIPKPQPNIRKPLSYQELANAQLPAIARGLNLDVDAERKREADLKKKNNDALDKQIKTKIEEDNLDKQLRKEARTEERKKRIKFLAEKKISGLQYGGPQELLNNTVDRLSRSKSLDLKFISSLQQDFEKRQERAFKEFSSKTGIFTTEARLNSVAKKLNISTSSEQFLQRREEIKQKRAAGMQNASFALPFVAGGIANSVGGQDTRAGRVTSGLGEAAGTALLLSQFGPLGIAAGATIGVFQVLSTVVKELTPDLNELSKKSRELSAANEREISSLQSFIQSTSQLKSLIDSNSSPSTIAQAKISLSESTRGLSGNSGLRLLRASTDEERTSVIQDVTLANQRKQALTDVNLLAGGIINEKASGVYNNLDRIGFNRRQLLDVGNTQTIANEIVKTIDLSKISNETISKAKSGTASLKDLGLDNAEIQKLFSDTNKFFSDGTVKTTGASDQILKFVQSLVVAQKSLDELSSRQVDTAKIFASTKESFLNILTGTFAQNQSANKNLISGNEIGFSKAETILAKLSQSLSPEELLKGSVKIKQAKIDQDFANQKISISNEYTNKILEDILSQAGGTSLQDQIKIQDVLNKSITGESPFDPLKLTGEIQGILGSDATKSLQSQLLKTSIEIAAKMEDSKNNLKRVQEELANQTEIEQKQLSDTRLINLFGGFSSNFRDVLRSIKQPKGGLTTSGNLSGLNAGDVSNLGSAKPGTIDAVDKSQRNVEIAKNRSELFSDIQLPEDVRKKINKINYKDLYLAGKSNIENRALAFGQQEIIPQFDILKSKIAGKDTGSFGRKAIDKQLEAVKKSFSIGQVADIKPEFVKTIQSLIPTADRDGSIQKVLDAILNNSEIVQGIFSSADSSAKALAEGTTKGGKLPPEFEAQITAIGNNTSILLKNTASLDKLEGVLRDLPFQIKDLREKSTKQIEAFGLSKQIETLQADTAFKTSTLERATDAGVILRSIITQADRTKADAKSIEDITSLGLTRLFPSMSSSNNPLSLFGAGSDMSGKQMQDFLKFENQPKIPSSPSELDDALKTYIANSFPNFSQQQRDKTFKKYSDDAAYKQLTSATSKDNGLLYGGGERDIQTLNQDILDNNKKIEELTRKLEELNSNTKVQSNDTTQVAPTTTQIAPTVNISFNGVGSVDPNKVKEAVYSALANINRENNLPPPIRRPVSNTLVA